MDAYRGRNTPGSSSGAASSVESPSAIAQPSITLPKGGGALRGLGEKFAANAVTGTGSMSIPIACSPGRSGFGPQLSLSYDSGAGNGPFGFGWSLSLPAIARKTDKGLPRYADAADSDVFVLSGAEDLVPVFRQDADGTWIAAHAGYVRDAAGSWVRDASGRLVVQEDDVLGYRVRRYRPRLEGVFARIERWTRIGAADDVHWRSISKENVLTVYGRDANSRIADPLDPSRIFTWLICETRDDKGHAVFYRYAEEDGVGVDLEWVHERNRGPRGDPRRTANRYLKRIHYGNRSPVLDGSGRRPRLLTAAQIDAQVANAGCMFEVVLDYGDHDEDNPAPAADRAWPVRADAFSSYRSGFEVRCTRLCQRVLMFHHFPGKAGVERDCLVRSTELGYSGEVDPTDVRNPVYTFLQSITQASYRRNNGGYDKRSLPPVEFEYTQPIVQDAVEDVDPQSLENLPIGLDGSTYRWTDLHGEGIPGILTEQAGAWYYKRNLSPIPETRPDGVEVVRARFAPLETIALKPAAALGSGAEFLDLAGDGQPDLVVMTGLTPGLYEHDQAEGWERFRAFTSSVNRDLRDPNLKFVDLDGDGHADLLITEDDALVWHSSRGEEGFGPARRVALEPDAEKGPRIVFADATQSVHLADMSGDNLTDIVRIRNGEVCYWPNLGYGRFGEKITMDNAPVFDTPDAFDQKRIRLADVDGSGTADIIYLHRDGVRLYFNQSGNSWGLPQVLRSVPRLDDVATVVPTDLLGNGTACLVWSSPLPGETRRQLRYVNLMGGQKPHLLFRTRNNLGAETEIAYASSTTFYFRDKRDGKPWITRLPFPVHVVETVTIYDHVSRNRFVSRHAYHHGYFDGDEREFRGFAMVEQWDTARLATFVAAPGVPAGNAAIESHVPPVHTKTWFHTGVHLGRDNVSDYFAGLLNGADEGEYFREPGLTDAEAEALLLPDTVRPQGLTLEEEREASRALKGSMLRQEVYADDAGPGASAGQIQRSRLPYTVTEQSFTVRALQPRGTNHHGVFFAHARETISFHYERNAADPRVEHTLTLEVDAFGNVLEQAAIGYGRRKQLRVVDPLGPVQQIPNPALGALSPTDQTKQTTTLVTYTENRVTNGVDSADAYRSPMACEAVTFELTGYTPTGEAGRFQASDLVEPDSANPGRLRHKFADEVGYEAAPTANACRRPIEWVRTLFRGDDLAALLPLGALQPLGLPGESYKLAFTPGLIDTVFRRPHPGAPDEPLLPNPAAVLGGQTGDRGGYVRSQTLKGDGRFPPTDRDDYWWIPSGRSFFSAGPADSAATELAEARAHFFTARRQRDAFGRDSTIDFDADDLLMIETRDALGNRVSVDANDYRVLQPRLISDANRNQTGVAFDTLGMVVATAVMGKPLPMPVEGDTLDAFVPDLDQTAIDGFFDAADPHSVAAALLQGATTRIVYDVDRFRRTRLANPTDPTRWQPTCAATLARETHVSSPVPPQGSRIQLSFSYADGFGREIQKKIQAEPGPLVEGGPSASPRWVGTGWTIFNNKGKPVRRYEPFFSARRRPNGTLFSDHRFEFGAATGVSQVLFYDPPERVVATLHPNHTFEKVVFDAWRQVTYDVNDTCAPRLAQTGDPRTDPDIRGYTASYFATLPTGALVPAWETWYTQRIDGRRGPDEQAAAARAAAHADTPTTTHLDALGRPFLTVARNRIVCAGHALDGTEESVLTRVDVDIEGNSREVFDERALPVNYLPAGAREQRTVIRYAYDMLGNRIQQFSMEAAARWTLNDASGKPIRAWDSRGHEFRTAYDALRRPLEQVARGSIAVGDAASDPRTLADDVLIDRIEYGEPPIGATPAEEDAARRLNLRTHVYRHFDSAGIATNARLNANGDPIEAYDFKGNLLHSTRQLATQYQELPNWALDPPPDVGTERFEGSTRYDALNRATQSIVPRSSLARATRTIVQPVFNEASLLERVDVWLERNAEPAGLIDPDNEAPSAVGVANIDYDGKGQRLQIAFKNGVTTSYRYDPETFRLVELFTERGAAFTGDCDNPQACGVQNLRYTYDPAGNVSHIEDDAQQTVYFSNQRIEPSNDYTYDALYRLIQATGREHLGQQGNGDRNPPTAPDGFNTFPIRLDHPNVLAAMGTYVERYVYDAVGNFLQVQHRGSDPAHAGWTRAYDYAEASLIEPGGGGVLAKANNRLTRTTLNPNGASLPAVEPYRHDVNGNIVRMPHLGGGAPGPNLHWDCCDRLRAADLGGGGAAYYVYDASGQRVRKVWEKSPGLIEERIYLGAGEIFRQHPGAIGADTAALERETVHVMDDKQRIAVVETRTLDRANADLAPRQQIRYQHGNHLGSGALELDQQADIVSYEEYTPYGSSSYQAVRSQTETAKRYRYTGKERDEESGFYYHGARYYAPWLARWTSVEPNPMEDGANAYVFCRNSPTRFLDANGRNSVEDLFKFLRDTGGFTAADMPKGGPPQFTSAHASPFGTSAHQAITNTLDEIKGLGKAAFKGIERIYGEVAVQHGTNVVQKIGGSPIRGHHNLDLVAMPQGQTLSVNQTLAAGAAEAVGDAKFGGGSITSAHSNFGQTGLTVNGASTPAAGPSLGAAAETEQAFSTLAKEFATESSAPKAPAANATASFDANVARATWKSLQGAGPKGVLSTLKSGAGKIVAGGGKVLGVLGNVASVAGAFVGGYQVGSGINQVGEGKVGLGTTDIVGGSAQLGVAIGVPAAVKAGAVVGGGAGALALVSGLAALSIGWAVEDTKRALEGKKTMTDEAVEYWSKNGVTKTFQDLWWQIKN